MATNSVRISKMKLKQITAYDPLCSVKHPLLLDISKRQKPLLLPETIKTPN